MIILLPIWLLTNAVSDNSSSTSEHETSNETESEWHSYSVALHILLPMAGFCILWGRRDLLTRLLLQIDRSCVAVCCPSLSQRERLLKWARENLPATWSSPSKTLSGGIPELWKDGSLLCTLINMAVPGACSSPPRHWKKPPMHAQALAYKYLGINPVFTQQEFEGTFTATQERKFLIYLQELEQAVRKYTLEDHPPNFSSNYIAKGMGLHTGEQHRKTIFYVYSNTTCSKCNNILVYIRGPYGTQGTATIPAFYNLNSISVLNYLHKEFKPRDKIFFQKDTRKSFLKSIALDFSSFVNIDKKLTSNEIPIYVQMEHDRARIEYIPNNFGMYEINLITNGELISGSPFTASVSENVSGIKEIFGRNELVLKQSPSVQKKKIISRVIDCIDEKIQLENEKSDIYARITEKLNEIKGSIREESNKTEISEVKERLRNLENIYEVQNEKEIESNIDDIPTEKYLLNEKIETKITPEIVIATDEEHSESSNNFIPKCNDDLIPPITDIENESSLTSDKATYKTSTWSESGTYKKKYIDNYISKISEERQLNSFKINANQELNNNRLVTMSKFGKNIQNRPTSIVSPILKNSENKLEEPKEIKELNGSHLNYSQNTNNLVAIFNEKKGKSKTKPTEMRLTTNQQTNKDSKEENTFVPEGENKEFDPEELLLSIRQNKNLIQNKYVENLKAILTKKMNPPENTKIIVPNSRSETKKNESENRDNNNYSSNYQYTSPICPAHIVPEVKLSLPVKSYKLEKTYKKPKQSFSSTENSSISKKENEEVLRQLDDQTCNLRVLTVIDSIKKSSYSLNRNTSKSTPNISDIRQDGTEDLNDSKKTFNKTKEYWKNISSITDMREQNTSSSTMKVFKTLSDFHNFHKSSDDMSTCKRTSVKSKKLQRTSSLNQKEFQAIEFTSIEERKKKLLQNKYEEENLGSRFIKISSLTKSKFQEQENSSKELQKETDFQKSPAMKATNNIQPIVPEQEKTTNKSEKKEQKQISEFMKAITFFRNLEKKPPTKRKPLDKKINKNEVRRRYSLEYKKQKKIKPKSGGSLRFPLTSEKFSIPQIYSDIMQNGRGSFKGTPNRKALTKSLASLDNSNSTNENEEFDDCIEYSLFLNKLKPKRRSIKSIFDIQY